MHIFKRKLEKKLARSRTKFFSHQRNSLQLIYLVYLLCEAFNQKLPKCHNSKLLKPNFFSTPLFIQACTLKLLLKLRKKIRNQNGIAFIPESKPFIGKISRSVELLSLAANGLVLSPTFNV